jgi:hypothetical protein
VTLPHSYDGQWTPHKKRKYMRQQVNISKKLSSHPMDYITQYRREALGTHINAKLNALSAEGTISFEQDRTEDWIATLNVVTPDIKVSLERLVDSYRIQEMEFINVLKMNKSMFLPMATPTHTIQ